MVLAELAEVAFWMREKANTNTRPSTPALTTSVIDSISSARPNVGRGFLRRTRKEALRMVPSVMGCSGISPGFGGGVQPGCDEVAPPNGGGGGGAGSPLGECHGLVSLTLFPL